MNHNKVNGDGHQFDDNYSVSPKAMSDEQIARRDAMSIVELADSAAAQSVTLSVQLEQVCRQVERLERERDEMRSLMREIVHEYDQTHDAEQHPDGRWTSAASIPVEVIERAKEMCK